MQSKLTKFSSLISDASLRNDTDFVINQINKLGNDFIRFTDLFEIIQVKKINYEEITEPFKYCQIGDIGSRNDKHFKIIDFDNPDNELNDYYGKIKNGDIFLPKKGQILISKVRPYLKKMVLVEEDDIFYSTAFIVLQPKINQIVAFYSLHFLLIDDINISSRQGKGYPTIKQDDLYCLNIPLYKFEKIIKLSNDTNAISLLETKTNELNKLRASVADESPVIDKIILEKLNINISPFFEAQKKVFAPNISKIADNIDLRISAKFNRPANDVLQKIQFNNDFIQLKNIVCHQGELGASISPDNFTEEQTDQYYLSMADISSCYINEENLKTITDEYFELNKTKTINMNDILITRSGEGGIGNVAIVENEISAVFCDFIIRYKIKNTYNPKFIYYYIRSIFGRYFVEVNKKGLGNNTNIFPNQFQYLPIPLIDKKIQDSIVNDLDNALSANRTVKNKIEEIYSAIEKTVNN